MPADDQLRSWKEVAAYLGRDARTVQRWEKTEGLPVHRHLHSKLGTVYAYRSELDQWLAKRAAPPALETVQSAPAPIDATTGHEAGAAIHKRRSDYLPVVLVGVGVIIAIAISWINIRPAPAASPPPVPLTSYIGDEWAGSFSPDGSQITYSWNGEQQDNFDIYTEIVGARKLVRVTNDPATDCSPVWSPDGHSIAFLRATPTGLASLWRIVPATGEETKLTDTNTPIAPHSRSLDWSPNSEWIAFSDRETPSHPTSLFLISVRTREKVRLTQPSTGQEDAQPAFSPDGRSIVFARDVGRGVSVLALLHLDADLRSAGSPVQLELKGFEKAGNSYPQWVPGGEEIVFVSDRGGTARLWRVSVPRGEPSLVASAGEGASVPVLSRSGSKLAYTQGTFDTNLWELEISRDSVPGAARPRRLLSSTRLEHNPHVSPDGLKLAFESNRSGYTEIWISDRHGSNAVPLTDFSTSVTGSPQWSPDGKRIAFDSRVEGQPELYVRVSGGQEVSRLTNHLAADVVPRWSRDGEWIYFASNRTGTFQIWKVPAGGGEPVQITRNGGFAAYESHDGTLFYTKTRSDVTELWQLTKAGDERGPVLKPLVDRSFAVVHDGIYFLAPGPPASVRFMSFATGSSTLLAALSKPVQFGLTLSPDGRALLYSQIDEQARDLMLIENFQ